MTSEQSKTLAFLARRVGALEKKVETLEDTTQQLVDILEQVTNNQDTFRPTIQTLARVLYQVQDHIKASEARWERCSI